MKKLYKIYQTVNSNWNTYDSAIVCANSEEEAKNMHPSGDNNDWTDDDDDTWCLLEEVMVLEIGIANNHLEEGIIIARFDAE